MSGSTSATEGNSAKTLVHDGRRTGVDHEAGAVERERARTNDKSVSWCACIERPSANDRLSRDTHVRNAGAPKNALPVGTVAGVQLVEVA